MPIDTAEKAPLVALVGRPNVGKSALFNRMTRRNRALVEDLPGTTRDRNYGVVEWAGRVFRLVDTGGLIESDVDPFSPLVKRGVQQAIDEADTVLFLVDATTGPIAADYEIAEMLRRMQRPIILVANKTDTSAGQANLSDFYSLGLGEVHSVSAIHGRGVGDLLDVVLDQIGGVAPEDAEDERIRVAIVGRPNVGKSSLTNAILGEERVLVSSIAGTTRDPIDTPFEFEGHQMLLVDTAGIRRRGRVERGIERHSVQRAEQAIDRADIVVVVLDEEEVLTAQDTHIAGYAVDAARGLIVVVNKWDLAEDRSHRPDLVRQLDHRYRFAPWAPVLFTSALTGEGIQDLIEMCVHIDDVRRRRVQTSEINRIIHRAMAEHGPPTIRHRKLKVMYVTQADISPPTFVFFVNDPDLVHFSYLRYLENQIRGAFDFTGTAIKLVFRKRSEDRFETSA
ncbi:MAG: ribosome biogenesis GTPase Der [Chloroflexi bacterium]|nr:ribosome biogenesis GTPase Der [Chloroflexota bacterium]MQC47814.1 ribosome biogenesis GTPase Der [Chloroflexota bacterium]